MSDNLDSASGTPAPALASETPQFTTAEYAHIPGTERCKICGSLISGEYYRVNTQMACSRCALEAQQGQPSDSHVAFLRALLFGAGAAVLGLILYSTVGIVTGYTIGYVSLAVGWLVGKAIIKGSNGMGGRRYQIAAILLTYAAISMSSIPMMISSSMKHRAEKAQLGAEVTSSPAPAADSGSGSEPGSGATSSAYTAESSSAPAANSASKPDQKMGFGAALAGLALIGLASPFLELQSPIHGAIGLFILFIGLSISYRLTASKPLDVDGPYNVNG